MRFLPQPAAQACGRKASARWCLAPTTAALRLGRSCRLCYRAPDHTTMGDASLAGFFFWRDQLCPAAVSRSSSMDERMQSASDEQKVDTRAADLEHSRGEAGHKFFFIPPSSPSARRQRWHAALIEQSAAPPAAEPAAADSAPTKLNKSGASSTVALDPASNPFVPAGLENKSAFPSGTRAKRSRRPRRNEKEAQAADEVGQRLRLQTNSTRHAEPTARRPGTERRGTARGSEKTESSRALAGKQRGSGRGPEAAAPGIAAPMQLDSDFPALCGNGYRPPPPKAEEAGRRWGAASACSRRGAHETMEQVNIDMSTFICPLASKAGRSKTK